MLVVFVEGNIGVGKSSALRALERAGQAVVYEQVAEWSLWLDRTKYPHRHTFSFQVQVCMSMFAHIRDAIQRFEPTHHVLYCERSILSSTVFGRAAHARGHMVDAEIELLADLASHLHADLVSGHKYLSVLLQCKPETAVKRIRDRGRSGEDNLDAKFVNDLHERFTTFCDSATVINTDTDAPCEVAKNVILKTQPIPHSIVV
jgi:deoxyadenosine/deoxycytidine kinase